MFKDIAPRPRTGTVTNARSLRRRMSLPEVLLWRELRARPLGLKFRRQHPSGRYVLDFFCSDARLAVEIDGGGHSHSDRAHLDLVRDAWFAEAGIATLRVPARLVLSDLRSAVDLIVSEALKRLPLHHASHGPPPRAKLGED